MKVEEVAALPVQPASEVEWEDLLLRLEIVPRVVRNGVDEVSTPERARRALVGALGRERRVGAWLESAAGVRREQRDAGAGGAEVQDLISLAHHFASLRARTFAMVQRRGLEVWGWRGPLDDPREVTAHQLLLWLARRDGELLAELRAASGETASRC